MGLTLGIPEFRRWREKDWGTSLGYMVSYRSPWATEVPPHFLLCMWWGECHSIHVEVKGQLGVGSLLPCEESNSGH